MSSVVKMCIRDRARTVGPLTITDIVRFAGAGGDFNPLHHDVEFAARAGFPTVLAHGQLTAGLLAGWVSDLLLSLIHIYLEALDAANEALANSGPDLEGFLEANIDFHVAVAKASHNELLSGFMMALSKAIYSATANEGFITDEVRATAVRAHRTITAAIRAKDSDAAVRRMSRHVHSHAEAALASDLRHAIDVTDES